MFRLYETAIIMLHVLEIYKKKIIYIYIYIYIYIHNIFLKSEA